MPRTTLFKLLTLFLVVCSHEAAQAEDDDKQLQGVWIAQSMEADGRPAPEDALKRMRFTFKDRKLHIQGNYKTSDEEMACDYKLDPKASPKHLDFTPISKEKDEKTVLAIYELKAGVLKICARHADSDKDRPKEFKSTAGSELLLIVFKQQAPDKKAPDKKAPDKKAKDK